MFIDFTGKTVVVTGAGVGIGREIALSFAASGGNVWACDILAEALAETMRMDPSGTIHTRRFDITEKRAVEAFVGEIGAPDILIHSAGGICGQVAKPLADVSAEEWQEIFDVNVRGLLFLAQAALPGMQERHKGSIVAISSVASARVALSGVQAYTAAKHAEIGLVKQLAYEFGPSGINVNSVAPGFIRSNLMTEKQWESMGPQGQEAVLRSFALRRMGSPKDVANAVMFLASDYASWITGQNIFVDGGSGPAMSVPLRVV